MVVGIALVRMVVVLALLLGDGRCLDVTHDGDADKESYNRKFFCFPRS